MSAAGPLLYLAAVAGAAAWNYGTIKWFTHRRDRYGAVTAVATVGSTLALALVLLVPLDVRWASQSMDWETGVRHEWATDEWIQQRERLFAAMYGTLGALLVTWVGVAVPFTYFYVEEQPLEASRARLVRSAGVQAALVASCVAAVFAAGAAFGAWTAEDDAVGAAAAQGLSVGFGGAAVAGLALCVGYAAPGLAMLAVNWVRGPTVTYRDLLRRVTDHLLAARDRRERVEAENAASSSRARQQLLQRLAQEEQALRAQQGRLERAIHEQAGGIAVQCRGAFRPFQISVGLAIFTGSALLLGTLVLVTADAFFHSKCGSLCGWRLEATRWFNPLDVALVWLARRAWPADLALFNAGAALLLVGTVYGARRIGLRILWLRLYSVRRFSTRPQALLLFSALVALALGGGALVVLGRVAPSYVTFGGQRVCLDGSCRPCGPDDGCTRTVSSLLFAQFARRVPLLFAASQVLQCVLIAVYLVALIIAARRRRQLQERHVRFAVQSDDSSDDSADVPADGEADDEAGGSDDDAAQRVFGRYGNRRRLTDLERGHLGAETTPLLAADAVLPSFDGSNDDDAREALLGSVSALSPAEQRARQPTHEQWERRTTAADASPGANSGPLFFFRGLRRTSAAP